MSGEERREQIVEAIRGRMLSGTDLSRKMGVSRQVIVQDIALLRTAGYDILSTRRGYILQEGASCRRVFHVTHDDQHTEDELNIFVDAGGRVLDVFVEHDVYGLIRGELNISSRRQVREFMENLETGKAVPLKALTCDEHWHTVIADSEETLDFIEGELAQRGYLLDD
ncbi:MAG: transcription repressor NadR [Lachnospiraceae bacterium]|nr:transcription repressor NadR [Lachnospiraceae bacterium]